jgi:two-component system response regulator MprA
MYPTVMDWHVVNNASILVIEKDEFLQTKLTEALTKAGYSVAVTNDIFDGFSKICEKIPDLIIMSCSLPLAKASKTFSLIREASYLPIVVLGSENGTVTSLNYGADAYIKGTPCIEELIAIVHSMLSRKSSQTILKQLQEDV